MKRNSTPRSIVRGAVVALLAAGCIDDANRVGQIENGASAGTGGKSSSAGTVGLAGGQLGVGGASTMGGATAAGGNSGTAHTTTFAGATATGGTTVGLTGGQPGVGGASTMGGATEAGGNSGTADTTTFAGATATGGITAGGGLSAMGGISANGGSSTIGGVTSTGGRSAATGGCCTTGGATPITKCTIGGVVYSADEANPNNPCQSCQLYFSSTAWSNLPDVDRISCGSGRLCRGGTCELACTINGIVYPSGAGNPASPCQQTCQPSQSTTAWSNVPPAHCVTAVAAGDGYACAIADDQAYCWGKNDVGQLGSGSSLSTTSPVAVQGLTSGVEDISVNRYPYYDSPFHSGHTCAIVRGGAYCWGDNSSGQIGNGTTNDSNVPVPVTGLTSGVQSITTGASFSCAAVSGVAYCWGYNGQGELGNGTKTDSLVPTPVKNLSSGVTGISAGYSMACALVNGGVKCWGDNTEGALGNNSTVASAVPVQVQGLTSGVQSMTAGSCHACAVVSGTPYCWGRNEAEQLGVYDVLSNSSVPVPVQAFTSNVSAISAGSYHSCAIVGGGAWCWGNNEFPVQIQGLTNGLTAIAAGSYVSCAVVDAAAWCWGVNSTGQLGNNSTITSSYPVQVQFP